MSQKSHKCIRLYPKPEVLNYRVAVCDVIGTHICMLVNRVFVYCTESLVIIFIGYLSMLFQYQLLVVISRLLFFH